MIVKCDLVESKRKENHEVCTSYGLVFSPCERNEEAVILFRDLSGNKAEVEKLRDVINANDLDELHIQDVIQDYITYDLDNHSQYCLAI